jgi:hypothetical protein
MGGTSKWHRLAVRAAIVLAAAEGDPDKPSPPGPVSGPGRQMARPVRRE